MGDRWTPTEDRLTDWKWGEEAFATTAGRTDRTVDAVRSRYRTRGMSSAGTAGRKTIAQVARETGYNWDQVARAIRACGLKPVRTSLKPRGRRHLLSEEQVARVLEHLGDETAQHATDAVHVTTIARRSGRSVRLTYQVAAELGMRFERGRLPVSDADDLVTALRRRRGMPPARSRRTVQAIAREAGRHWRWVYVVASREPKLVPGLDGQLAPQDAAKLRRRLGLEATEVVGS